MRAVLAGVLSIGILVFTIGLGMFLIYHSEAETIVYPGTTELNEQYESLNSKVMQGFFLMACGGSVALFVISPDEERRAKEREKEKGFFA